jgi:DNA-binding phage protein
MKCPYCKRELEETDLLKSEMDEMHEKLSVFFPLLNDKKFIKNMNDYQKEYGIKQKIEAIIKLRAKRINMTKIGKMMGVSRETVRRMLL